MLAAQCARARCDRPRQSGSDHVVYLPLSLQFEREIERERERKKKKERDLEREREKRTKERDNIKERERGREKTVTPDCDCKDNIFGVSASEIMLLACRSRQCLQGPKHYCTNCGAFAARAATISLQVACVWHLWGRGACHALTEIRQVHSPNKEKPWRLEVSGVLP